MRRLALLIAHPGEIGAENYLTVDEDIIGWKRHLLSPLGGKWRESEILVLMSPTSTLLQKTLDKWKGQVDYALIVFSGHGCFSAEANDTMLELNSAEVWASKRLRLANKETIVLDCCRKVVEQHLLKSMVLESIEASAKMDFPNPGLARAAFETQVNKCADAALILHSCDVDEFAYDDEFGRGGAYTHALLKAAADWWPNRELGENKYLTYSVVAAHNKAVDDLAVDGDSRQNPKIKKPRSEPYFPLSVWA